MTFTPTDVSAFVITVNFAELLGFLRVSRLLGGVGARLGRVDSFARRLDRLRADVVPEDDDPDEFDSDAPSNSLIS